MIFAIADRNTIFCAGQWPRSSVIPERKSKCERSYAARHRNLALSSLSTWTEVDPISTILSGMQTQDPQQGPKDDIA